MKMPTSLRRNPSKPRTGQALIETALVLPLLILLVLSLISYGLYINAVTTIQQAVRVGARSAAIGDTLGCPGNSALQELSHGSRPTVYGMVDDQINHDQPWLTTTTSSTAKPVVTYAAVIGNRANAQQQNVLLTVAYPYQPLIPLPGLLPAHLVIAQTYQMMVETAQPSHATTTTQPTGSPYDETSQYTTPPPPSSATYLRQPGYCSG